MRDGDWVYRRQPSITRSIAELGDTTPDGKPFLRPEIQLLYKSKRIRTKDEADFREALPALAPAARAWLARALATIDPAHVWLDRLR